MRAVWVRLQAVAACVALRGALWSVCGAFLSGIWLCFLVLTMRDVLELTAEAKAIDVFFGCFGGNTQFLGN